MNSHYLGTGTPTINKKALEYQGLVMVPGAGVEPARNCFRGILSPLRLPVPPSRHALPT